MLEPACLRMEVIISYIFNIIILKIYHSISAIIVSRHHHDHHDDQQHQPSDYDEAHALLRAFVMLLRLLQLFLPLLHVVLSVSNMCFDAVYLFTLGIHQGGQLVEQLHALHHGDLQLLDVPIFVLDIADPVVEGDAGLTVDFLLQHLLGQIWVFHILFQLVLVQVGLHVLDLPFDLFLHFGLELILVALLFLENFSHFLS